MRKGNWKEGKRKNNWNRKKERYIYMKYLSTTPLLDDAISQPVMMALLNQTPVAVMFILFVFFSGFSFYFVSRAMHLITAGIRISLCREVPMLLCS